MRSRMVWAGIAILVIALVVLVLLLRPSERAPTASVPHDAGTVAPASTAHVAAAPALVDAPAAGAYQPPVAQIEMGSDPEPIGKGSATLVGRVLGEDGKPIAAFSIVIARGELGGWRVPGRIETKAGRFSIDTIQAGTWNVFFAVPKLARKWVPNVTLVDGQTTDIGDVVIDGGLTIRGRVLDGASKPVAGAKVSTSGRGMRITQIGATKMTEDYRVMLGDRETVSDANGTYVLGGVVPEIRGDRLTISAQHATLGSSQSVPLPDDDAAIDLVIGATGSITGTVVDTKFSVAFVGLRGTHSKVVKIVDGHFEATGLGPGEYEVVLSEHDTVRQPRTVTVGLNAKASVTFGATQFVVVDVTGCDAVGLSPAGIDVFGAKAIGSCRYPGHPTFPRVEPGRYRLCESGSCVDIEVASAPARQSFAAPPPRKP